LKFAKFMESQHQVDSSDELLRWLHPGQFNWQENRPTSAAFKDAYMSVDVALLTTVEESYSRAQKIGKNAVVSFKASTAFEADQKVVHCPSNVLSDAESVFVCQWTPGCPIYRGDVPPQSLVCVNGAHACVIGKKTPSRARALRAAAVVKIYPPEQIAPPAKGQT
jgi:hypothetical protein